MEKERKIKFIEKYTQYKYEGDMNDLRGIDNFFNKHSVEAVNQAVMTMIND